MGDDDFKQSEADTKCCLCFPIKCGMQTLSVFSILGAIMKCAGLAASFNLGVACIVLGAIWTVLGLWEAWLAISFLRDTETASARAGLITMFYL